MDISEKGLKLIQEFEGCRLIPYNDSVGYATVGVGHLIGKRKVTADDLAKYKGFTDADALRLLKEDVSGFVKSLNTLLSSPVTQNQFDAMVSLAFNIGVGNFTKSSVLRFTNAKEFDRAAEAFKSWNKAGGKVLTGLTNRRLKESQLYKGM